jgi:hypothetical protein
MWVYWQPRGGPAKVRVPWWLALSGPGEVSPIPGPVEAIVAVVVIAISCYIGLAWALCYVRLGIVRGTGAIRKRSAFG